MKLKGMVLGAGDMMLSTIKCRFLSDDERKLDAVNIKMKRERA